MNEQELIRKAQLLIEELKNKHGYDQAMINKLVNKEETLLPVTIFSGTQSPLRALVTYLHQNEQMELNKIAKSINRSYRAVWGAKQEEKITPQKTTYYLPLSAFNNKKSILETIVTYLREHEKLKFTTIARILNKDPRTIWTVGNRAQKKRG